MEIATPVNKENAYLENESEFIFKTHKKAIL